MNEIALDERKLLGDGSFAEDEVAGAVDAVGGDEFATTQVEATEVAVPGGVTVEDDFVVAGVEASDLQLEIVLIRPEPGKRLDLPRFATDGRGGDLGLLVRAGHGLHAYTAAVTGHVVACAVSGGHDVGVTGSGMVVDHHTVVQGQARCVGEFCSRFDTDAHDDQISRDRLAGGQEDLADAVVSD